MTNKEAIEYNKNLRMYMKLSDRNQSCKFLEENYIALDMAIKALEQQPCDDTRMIDKSNFSMEQYKIDIQSAYDCGKAEYAKFFEFLSNIINPNEMEQYLAMYHSEEEKANE